MPYYSQFDVLRVPFPFSEGSGMVKTRPAVVVSKSDAFHKNAGIYTVAMVTSARHSAFPLDLNVTGLAEAGLPKESMVRMKFFSVTHASVIEKKGRLSAADRRKLKQHLHALFGL